MMLLSNYKKVKDKYCISYHGNCSEYIVQLVLLLPCLEQAFPGVLFYISCKDEQKQFVPKKHFIEKEKTKELPCVYNLMCDMKCHPVEKFFLDSGVKISPITIKDDQTAGPTVISTKAFLPTKSLNNKEIDRIQEKFPGSVVNQQEKIASVLISLENENLFLAAARGAKTILIPTGFGKNLFKTMFPAGEILDIDGR